MSYQRRTEIAAGEVRAHLGRARQSIQDLADATGIPISTLNRRLRVTAPVPFNVDELDVIAQHFGVDAIDLLRAPAVSAVAV